MGESSGKQTDSSIFEFILCFSGKFERIRDMKGLSTDFQTIVESTSMANLAKVINNIFYRYTHDQMQEIVSHKAF